MFRTILIGLLIASCNNPPPPPRTSGNSGAQSSAHMIATPRGASSQLMISLDRARIEARLVEHETEIEAAFASGDCQTIALKRAAVEAERNYNPPIAVELRVYALRYQHSQLEEYDNRTRELGCELRDCLMFTDINLVDSPTPQTVSGTTAKDTQAACYRVRNTQDNQPLSVKASARATRDDIDVYIESGDGDMTRDGETVTLEVSPIAAFAVRSPEMGDDGIVPEEGWQAIPFALTVTPVLRPAVAGQAPAPTATQTAKKTK